MEKDEKQKWKDWTQLEVSKKVFSMAVSRGERAEQAIVSIAASEDLQNKVIEIARKSGEAEAWRNLLSYVAVNAGDDNAQ